jgi:hypothetical protein
VDPRGIDDGRLDTLGEPPMRAKAVARRPEKASAQEPIVLTLSDMFEAFEQRLLHEVVRVLPGACAKKGTKYRGVPLEAVRP